VSKIRKIHKSREEKKINLNLTELKYAGADNDSMKKSQEKKANFKILKKKKKKRKKGKKKNF